MTNSIDTQACINKVINDLTDPDNDYFKPIPYGYKCYTGHVLPDVHVDSLNALTLRYKTRVEAGFPLSEQHLNDRHRLFNSYARVGI